MTKKEYQKMVKESEAFRALAKGVQQMILEADDVKKMKYQQIFLTEKNGIICAKKNMIEKNNNVLKTFSVEIKKIGKSKRMDDEKKQGEIDKKDEELLLLELNNL